jgi:hypothetical protein
MKDKLNSNKQTRDTNRNEIIKIYKEMKNIHENNSKTLSEVFKYFNPENKK